GAGGAEAGRHAGRGGGQGLGDVTLDGGEVEALDLLGVVEVLAHGVGHVGVLGKDLQVEPVRPPLPVVAALGGVGGPPGYRAAASALRFGVGDDRIMVLGHVSPSDQALEQVGQRPQKMTSASSIAKPWSSDAFRQGACPVVQSTSATAPHDRQTMWWWLSPTRPSNRAALPAGSMRRTRPAAVSAWRASYTAWREIWPTRSRTPAAMLSTSR